MLITSSAYPPVGTLLYLGVYLLSGTGALFLAPLVVQFTFYLLAGVFLYKTINLFCDKRTALTGASLYLFSPIIYTYATLDLVSSGTVFFIAAVSYFFLKFIRDGDSEHLILTAYFISVGSLYRRVIIVMFFVCGAYVILNRIKRKDLHLTSSLLVLSLSIVSFLPWHFIGTRGADTTNISHIFSIDNLLSYFWMIPSQLSWPVFSLFLVSIPFILFFKRSHLTLLFGLVFASYYSLFTLVEQQSVHRYSMSFYPAIAVFLVQLLQTVSQKFRRKYIFELLSLALIVYLAILAVIPRSSTRLITFKYSDWEIQHFPSDKALDWLLKNTKDNEKVLRVFFNGGSMSLDRYDSFPKNKFVNLGLVKNIVRINDMFASGDLDSFRKYLKELCKKEDVSYIVFTGSNSYTIYSKEEMREKEIKRFLEEDKHDDFIVAAKFNLDDNYIYIYKLRDSFIEAE
jgi:hypothetical protein